MVSCNNIIETDVNKRGHFSQSNVSNLKQQPKLLPVQPYGAIMINRLEHVSQILDFYKI